MCSWLGWTCYTGKHDYLSFLAYFLLLYFDTSIFTIQSYIDVSTVQLSDHSEELECSSDCLNNLQMVKIHVRAYRISQHAMSLIRFILANSTSLRTLTFKVCPGSKSLDAHKISQDLLRMERASQRAHVEFLLTDEENVGIWRCGDSEVNVLFVLLVNVGISKYIFYFIFLFVWYYVAIVCNSLWMDSFTFCCGCLLADFRCFWITGLIFFEQEWLLLTSFAFFCWINNEFDILQLLIIKELDFFQLFFNYTLILIHQ